ncbi:MAG: hypothetical protein ACLFTI_12215 [Anaerolineales bacterium]
MTYQELVAEIEDLSLDEQLSLVRTLIQSINQRTLKDTTADTSIERVRGIFKPAGPIPIDADLADDYTDYLIRKYT